MADERLSAEQLDRFLRRGVIERENVAALVAEVRAAWAELETTRSALRSLVEAWDSDAVQREMEFSTLSAPLRAARALVGSVPQPEEDE